jgi:lysyl endopeptidase
LNSDESYFPKNDPIMNKQIVIVFCILCAWVGALSAQTTYGGQPLGMRMDIPLPKAPLRALPALAIDELLAEDAARGGNRFAAAQAVDLRPEETGVWTELADGTQLWRLRIEVPNAYGLLLFYDNFDLPDGAKLFVYRPDLEQVLGSYTKASAAGRTRFMTGVVDGDAAVVEYQAPAGTTRTPFRIFRVDGVYRSDTKSLLSFGFGTADPCHDNITCPEAQEWQLERNAVARVMLVVEGGSGFCTGTLVNNTAEDGRLLFLTAFHCMDGFTPLYDLWRFDFYYASESCDSPDFEPFYQSILGCDSLSGRQSSDYLLLDLYPENTEHLNLHFVGWDRSGTPPDTAAIISHPRGDLQKFGFSSSPSSVWGNSIRWNSGVLTPPNHHFLVTYSDGTIEPGSSGAGLLDKNHRLTAVLQGDNGTVDCDAAQGYFGRISLAWTGGGTPASRLKDWLDPLDTDTMFIDAFSRRPVATIRTPAGDPVSGVGATFQIDGQIVDYVETGVDGRLEVPAGLPETGMLTITLSKDENDYDNGVRTSDLIEITQHILATDTLGAPYRILACDVNQSSRVTTLDMIRIRKLILGLNSDFGEGGAPSWQFYQDDLQFVDPLEPWLLGTRTNSFTIDLSVDWSLPDFVAVKSGDANNSALTGG